LNCIDPYRLPIQLADQNCTIHHCHHKGVLPRSLRHGTIARLHIVSAVEEIQQRPPMKIQYSEKIQPMDSVVELAPVTLKRFVRAEVLPHRCFEKGYGFHSNSRDVSFSFWRMQ
jgi:hypothetical protein